MKKNRLKVGLIITSVGLLALGLMSFGTAKVSQASKVFEQIRPSISKIGDFSLKGTNLRCKISILLFNPTPENFNASTGGLVEFSGLNIMVGQKIIGWVDNFKSLSGIDIPAWGNVEIKDIFVTLTLSDVAAFLVGEQDLSSALYTAADKLLSKQGKSLLDTIKSSGDRLMRELMIRVHLKAFGLLYTIEQRPI